MVLVNVDWAETAPEILISYEPICALLEVTQLTVRLLELKVMNVDDKVEATDIEYVMSEVVQ